MRNISQIAYRPGKEIVFGEWTESPFRPGEQCQEITCKECGLTNHVFRTDTFHGGNKYAQLAEKLVLQNLIDRGCTHIQVGDTVKMMEPADFSTTTGKKGRASKSTTSTPKGK